MLLGLLRKHQFELAEALDRDFSGRSAETTRVGDIFPTVAAIKYVIENLSDWMRPEPRRVGLVFQMGSANVRYEPRGVVAVLAPWNYPIYLGLTPVVYALAAGNRVLFKPSELVSEGAQVLERILNEAFSPEVLRVVTGGPEVARELVSLPLDYVLFTGSTSVGREVMRACAANLTPVTLELGGKSPCIVHESFSLTRAAQHIVAGKFLNAGQTCVAPDYVWVHESRGPALLQALRREIAKQFPTLRDNPDYTAIVNGAHYDRVSALVVEAEQKGAEATVVNPGGEELSGTRKYPPTLLSEVDWGMRVLQDEIFGPVLPVVTYRSLDDVVAALRDRPKPLALYYFDDDTTRVHWLLDRVPSGGVTVNGTILHLAQDDLPFGGIGASGMGAYHGREGFLTFSHARSVFHQGRVNPVSLLHPPYGQRMRRLLRFLIGR
jgi:acyl-CoA reductase-like NAD-dependent aldehyde dehydrogenase